MTDRIPDMGGLTRLSDAEMDALETQISFARQMLSYQAWPVEKMRSLCAEVRMLRAIVGAITLARLDAGEERSQ